MGSDRWRRRARDNQLEAVQKAARSDMTDAAVTDEDLEKAEGVTEITELTVDRLDGVHGPANGTPVLLMKSLDEEPVEKALTHAHQHFHGDLTHHHVHAHTGSGEGHGDGSKYPHAHDHAPGQELDPGSGDVIPTPIPPVAGAVGPALKAMATCQLCDGSGKIREGNVVCPECKGSGKVTEESLEKAQLSSAEMNDHPDEHFAYVEPGGTKDGSGKTTPRSKRHFLIHDKAHADNAAARIGQGAEFGDKALPKVEAAQKRFGTEAVAKADGDEPGSPGWEAQDASLARQATQKIVDLRAQLRELRDREWTESQSESDDVVSIMTAMDALEFILTQIAVFAVNEQAEAMAPVEKALRAISSRLDRRINKESDMTKETEEKVAVEEAVGELGKAFGIGEPGIPPASGLSVDNIKPAAAGTDAEEDLEAKKTTGHEDVPAVSEDPPDTRGDEGKTISERAPSGSMQTGADQRGEEALEDKKTTGHEDVPAAAEEPDDNPEHRVVPMARGLAKSEEPEAAEPPPAEPAAKALEPAAWSELLKSEEFTDELTLVLKSVVQSDEFGEVLKAQLAPIVEDQVKAAVSPLEDRVKKVEDEPARPQPFLRGRATNPLRDHLVSKGQEAELPSIEGETADEVAKALNDIKDPTMRDLIGRRLAESAHPFGSANQAQ
jgi:hypothetical protein